MILCLCVCLCVRVLLVCVCVSVETVEWSQSITLAVSSQVALMPEYRRQTAINRHVHAVRLQRELSADCHSLRHPRTASQPHIVRPLAMFGHHHRFVGINCGQLEPGAGC